MFRPERIERNAESGTRRSGFTLPEILVALVITAMIAVMARQIAEQLGDAGSRLIVVTEAADREADAERQLRAILGSYEEHAEDLAPFEGGSRVMHFRSWCDSAAGWVERCDATLVIEPADSGTTMRAELAFAGSRRVVPLGRVEVDATFRYLRDPGNGGTWTDAWRAGASAPIAVQVPFGRETLLVRIGERG